ncbi:serine protein kinase [Sesbania bispinosa]|nr:serine protein kinase [Sesbania bispinosa]
MARRVSAWNVYSRSRKLVAAFKSSRAILSSAKSVSSELLPSPINKMINTENVGGTFLIGGFDEFETIRKNLESMLHLLNGFISLVVPGSESGKGKNMATLFDHLKNVLFKVQNHPI